MPGDLSDPEQLFPFYYDSRYEPSLNPFENELIDLDSNIQDISTKLGVRLNDEQLKRVKRRLDSRGLLTRNPGDQEFRSEIKKFVKDMILARKVARSYAQFKQ